MIGPIVMLAGIGDFFMSVMSPLHAAMSFVLMWAYRGWSLVTGADSGVTWALTIMSLTVVVRTILIPLFIRQMNSARNMTRIQPKMKEVQDKYGADRQKLGIETQKLLKAEGANPAASCVPMLLQMPVFFALYQVLYAAANGQARGYFFVQNPDLVASLTNADVFGARLAGRFWLTDWSQFGATQVLALVLVLMMSALFFITQKQLMGKNMPPSAMQGSMAQQQKIMLYMFPVVYLFMGTMIPVGVLVYWVTNNLWTMGQQWLLIRNNPTPDTPAYIEWEERMIKKGRDPVEVAAQRQAKRFKKPAPTSASRPVAPAGRPGSAASGGQDVAAPGAAATTGPTGVVRQQIQRQQPNRQSRATRTSAKTK
jgi:YidC/Oxa1 family membrane protein insertase